jgi:hypothetical protein
MAGGGFHRDVAKEQFWREQIGGQASSGLSIRRYCRRHRLRESTFYFWRCELVRRGAGVASGRAFVPVRLADDSAGRDTAAGERAEAAVQSAGWGPATAQRAEEPSGSCRILSPCIEILLPGGRQVRLVGPVDRGVLADVLAVLDDTSAASNEKGRAC